MLNCYAASRPGDLKKLVDVTYVRNVMRVPVPVCGIGNRASDFLGQFQDGPALGVPVTELRPSPAGGDCQKDRSALMHGREGHFLGWKRRD